MGHLLTIVWRHQRLFYSAVLKEPHYSMVDKHTSIVRMLMRHCLPLFQLLSELSDQSKNMHISPTFLLIVYDLVHLGFMSFLIIK